MIHELTGAHLPMDRTYPTLFALALTVLFTSSCSPSIHQQRLSQVRSAAIVGFAAELPANPTYTSSTQGALQAYDQLATSLHQALGWNLTARAALADHPFYVKHYQQRVQGSPLRSLENTLVDFSDDFYLPGIMWSGHVKKLNTLERQELMRQLGLDAIAIAQIQVERCSEYETEFKSTSAYQAKLAFEVYDKTNPDPIWVDRWVIGEPSNIANHGDPEEIGNRYLEAIAHAYANLIERYEAHR